MVQQKTAIRENDDIDPRLREFIQNKVNTFVKWDLVRFFHDHPDTTDTPDSIAQATGRDVSSIQSELVELAEAGILQAQPLKDTTAFMLCDDKEIRWLVNTFILACDNRQFRVRAIYHVIRRMRED